MGDYMITLRQGKAKTLLENSRNSALTAVETYNKPNNKFRLENYIILMIIAWTKLFRAYFQATMGARYFYKEKNGRYKLAEGEKKGWDLRECLKKYREDSPPIPISDAVVANLEMFIKLRNKIEHRYWDSSEFDILLFGECQALLYNYENLLVGLFGTDYSINTSLAFALQFSYLRTNEQLTSQRLLQSKEMQDIKQYIDKYKADLSQEVFDSQEYSIRFVLIPKVSNTKRSDLAVEFVSFSSLDENDKAAYEKITAIIKDKLVVQSVSNSNNLKPSQVINAVKFKTGLEINITNHTSLWKAFGIRPQSNSKAKFETNSKFCIYDKPHNDYVYTYEWVDFISKLLTEYDFSKENINKKCSVPLRIEDYL